MKTIEALRKLHNETKAEVYIVGGYVRDFLLGRKSNDLDIVVRKASIKNIMAFLVKYGKVKRIALSKDSNKFEMSILSFRGDDGIEAQISLPKRGKKQFQDTNNTLRQDALYRDFTINAMYLPINYKSEDDVIDIIGGKLFITMKKIITNGSPTDRFKESPIRMLRAISLAARTGFSIDELVVSTIKHLVGIGLLRKVPVETIRKELNTILLSKKPSKWLKLMLRVGILDEVMPELARCANTTQDKRHHKYNVFQHCIYTCDNIDPNLTLRLAALLHDVGKYDTRNEVKEESATRVTFHKHEMASVKAARILLLRLKYSTKTTKNVLHLIRHHMYHYTREFTDAAVRKAVKRYGITEKDLNNLSEFPLFKLRAAERLGNGLKKEPITDRQRDFEKRIIEVYKASRGLEIEDLEVNGDILQEIFNLRKGKDIGEILKFLLEKVLADPGLNKKLTLLKLTTEYLAGKLEK